MAHRREHESMPRRQRAKVWLLGSGLVVAFALAIAVAVLTLR